MLRVRRRPLCPFALVSILLGGNILGSSLLGGNLLGGNPLGGDLLGGDLLAHDADNTGDDFSCWSGILRPQISK